MDERPGAIDASRVGSDADDGEMRFRFVGSTIDLRRLGSTQAISPIARF